MRTIEQLSRAVNTDTRIPVAEVNSLLDMADTGFLLVCCMCGHPRPTHKFSMRCETDADAEQIAKSIGKNNNLSGVLVTFAFCGEHKEVGQCTQLLVKELGCYSPDVFRIAQQSVIEILASVS